MRGDGLESFRLFLAFRTFIRHPSKFTVQPMRIALLSSEVVPFAKTGGLADVAGALPKALTRHDVDARIILPLYQQIDRSLLNDSVIEDVPVQWRGQIADARLSSDAAAHLRFDRCTGIFFKSRDSGSANDHGVSPSSSRGLRLTNICCSPMSFMATTGRADLP